MVYNKLSETKMGRRHVITDRIISTAETQWTIGAQDQNVDNTNGIR